LRNLAFTAILTVEMDIRIDPLIAAFLDTTFLKSSLELEQAENLPVENIHVNFVVICAAQAEAFTAPPDLPETDAQVGFICPAVEGADPQLNVMKVEQPESVIQKKPDCFAAVAFSPFRRIADKDAQFGGSLNLVHAHEPAASQELIVLL
jgi:hypothetical protein